VNRDHLQAAQKGVVRGMTESCGGRIYSGKGPRQQFAKIKGLVAF
jgi:hypothetical protein